MSEAEALAVLNVTQRRPKWLLSQVHPDKHPGFEAEATMATARVNQAMDVRSRHVNEVKKLSLNVSPSHGHSSGLKGVCLAAVLSDFMSLFLWGRIQPESEGSRDADPGIKSPPDSVG